MDQLGPTSSSTTSWTPRAWAAWMATSMSQQSQIVDDQLLLAEAQLWSARQRVLARSSAS